MIRSINLLFVLAIFIFFNSIAFQSTATHLMGSDFSWKNVGQDSFEVTITIYRDCKGISLARPELNVYCKDSGTSANLKTKAFLHKNTQGVTRKCDTSCSKCSSSGCSFSYGIEEHQFTYLIAFSQNSCKKILFNYADNARNNSITTGPEGPYYIEAWFDRSKAPKDNSPDFKNLPIRLICKDEPVFFDQGVTDKDGDSLVYQWTPPLRDSLNPVTYDPPYSYKEPVEHQGSQLPDTFPMPYGYHLDEQTGKISFTPTRQQVTVMAFKVKIFRNGQLIGETRRDMQVAIEDCANNGPDIQSNDMNESNYSNTICLGDTSVLNFTAEDPDNDSVNFTFQGNHLPGNPTFVSSSDTGKATATFKWAPPKKALKNSPHQFQIKAEDNNCPLPGRGMVAVDLHVVKRPKGLIEQNHMDCGWVSLTYNDTNNLSKPNALSLSWIGKDWSKSGDTIQQQLPPGKHEVKLTVSNQGCLNTFKDTVQIDPNTLAVDAGNDTTVCPGSSVVLNSKLYNGKGNVQYTWSNGDTATSTKIQDVYQTKQIGLTVTDTSQCSFTDSVTIKSKSFPAKSKPVNSLKDQEVCLTNNPLTVTTGNRGDYHQWSDQSKADSFEITEPGQYYLEVYDSTIGCGYTDSFKVSNELPASLFPDTLALCDSNPQQLMPQDTGQLTYWNTGDTANSITVSSSGQYWAHVTTQQGCTNSDTIQIITPTSPTLITEPSDTSFCAGDTLTLKAGSNASNFSWNTGSSDSSIQVTQGGKYWVSASNGNGCQTTDTFQLTTLNDCVWPGDANNDLVANNQDILTIGMKYNQQGPARADTSIQWNPKKAADWNDTFSSGLNTKFADANGDGKVDGNDTLAVNINYGKTHQKKGNGLNKKGETPLSVNIASDSLEPGTSFEAQINLGTSSNTADSIYGLAFTLGTDDIFQDDLALTMEEASNWFGQNNDAFLTFRKKFSNRFEVALTRTDKQNISGHGRIATLEGTLKNDVNIEQNTHLVTQISNAILIQKDGTKVPFELKGVDSAQIFQKENSVIDASEYDGLEIYPNPAKAQITIHIKNDHPQSGQLLNMQGQSVQSFNLREGRNQVQVEDLASGIYTLTIELKGQTVNQRMVIE